MSDSLRCEIPGPSCPQGSMKGFVVGGKAKLTSASKGLNAWRGIALPYLQSAIAESGLETPLQGPVAVWVFEHRLKPKSRTRRQHSPDVKPDIDKIARACLDVLVISGVLRDDAQVCNLVAEKRYAEKACVTLLIETMDD